MGILQGSILSPALFSLKINNIVNAVLKGTDCSLFVDDFALKLIDDASCLDIAPWTLSAPTVRFDLTKFKKTRLTLKASNSFICNLLKLLFFLFLFLLTDGSKTEEGDAAVAVSTKRTKLTNYLLVGFQTTTLYLLWNYELFVRLSDMFIVPRKNRF